MEKYKFMQKKVKLILFLLVGILVINFSYAFDISSYYCDDGNVTGLEQCEGSGEVYYFNGEYIVLGCQPSLGEFLGYYGDVDEMFENNNFPIPEDKMEEVMKNECTCKEGIVCSDRNAYDPFFFPEAPVYFSPNAPSDSSVSSLSMGTLQPSFICEQYFSSSICNSCISVEVPICGNNVVEEATGAYRAEECDSGWSFNFPEYDQYKKWIDFGCVPPVRPNLSIDATEPQREEYLYYSSQLSNDSRPCTYIDQSNTTNTGCANVTLLPECTSCPEGQKIKVNSECAQECLCPTTPICTSNGGISLQSCTSDLSSATANIGYYLDESGNFGLGCNLNLFSSKSTIVNGLDLYAYNGSVVYSQNIGESVSSSFSKNYLISDYSYQSDESLAIMCVFRLSQTDSSAVCNNDCQVNSQWSGDFDGDSYWGYERTFGENCTIGNKVIINPSIKGYDCKDTIVADTNGFYGFDRTCSQGMEEYKYASDKNAFCYSDTNNEGIGDFANCSYCRNPSMQENADDIDNNCKGTCQGNVSRSCSFFDNSNTNYLGDGAIDNEGKLSCSGVVNSWGVQDSFCQMVDDNVNTSSGEVCGGYYRAVKWGYENISKTTASGDKTNSYCLGRNNCNLSIQNLLMFKPGGIISPLSILLGDFREKDSFIGLTKFTNSSLGPGQFFVFIGYRDAGEAGSLDSSMPQYSMLSNKNKEGEDQITRGTNFGVEGTQFIDSFRGEFNKKMGSSSISIFDLFWDRYNSQIQKKTDNEFDFKWQTACVAKDKCADGADNNGLFDLRSAPPFNLAFGAIKSIEIDGKETPLVDGQLQIMHLFDEDDLTCKIDGGATDISEDYDSKLNPYNDTTYCIDQDRDGYCVNSEVFPDCIDSNTDTGGFLLSSYKFNEDGSYSREGKGESLSPKDVHPFAYVTDTACTIGVLDLNCNGNSASNGRVYTQVDLLFGKTPFDKEVNTGVERYYGFNFNSNPNSPAQFGNERDDPLCDLGTSGIDMGGAQDMTFATLAWLPIIRSSLGLKGVFSETAAFYRSSSYAVAEMTAGQRTLLTSMRFAGKVVTTSGTLYMITQTPDTAIRLTNLVNSGSYDGDLWTALDDAGVVSLFAAYNPVLRVYSAALVFSSISSKASAAGKSLSGTFVKVKDKMRQVWAKPTTEAIADAKIINVPGCFLENTSVTLANGSLINIEDLKVGASVVAFDLETNKSVVANITATMVRDENNYRVVEYG